MGTGAFGTVKLAKHKRTGLELAIKVIKKSHVKTKNSEQLMEQELKHLYELDHQHITSIYQLLYDDENYFCVMEYLSGGNLLNRVMEMKKFTEQKAANIME